MQNNNGNKEYKNVVVTGVSSTRDGKHFTTSPFDGRVADLLEVIVKEIRAEIAAGRTPGKFLIRKRSPESIANSRSRSEYFLEHVPASEVQEYESKNRKVGL